MQTKRAGVEVAGGLQSLVQSGSLVGLCEEELLARFIEGKDARAFKAIIDRHGPVVLAVCRHLLSDPNDVEDAFQATFLILIRKGGTIRRPASLASWLHGVAHRTAVAAEAVAPDHPTDDRPGGATASLPGREPRADQPSPREIEPCPRSTACPSSFAISRA